MVFKLSPTKKLTKSLWSINLSVEKSCLKKSLNTPLAFISNTQCFTAPFPTMARLNMFFDLYKESPPGTNTFNSMVFKSSVVSPKSSYLLVVNTLSMILENIANWKSLAHIQHRLSNLLAISSLTRSPICWSLNLAWQFKILGVQKMNGCQHPIAKQMHWKVHMPSSKAGENKRPSGV